MSFGVPSLYLQRIGFLVDSMLKAYGHVSVHIGSHREEEHTTVARGEGSSNAQKACDSYLQYRGNEQRGSITVLAMGALSYYYMIYQHAWDSLQLLLDRNFPSYIICL